MDCLIGESIYPSTHPSIQYIEDIYTFLQSQTKIMYNVDA